LKKINNIKNDVACHIISKTKNMETRYTTEVRANLDSGIITGTAIVFNSVSNLLGNQFHEVIKPSAATEEFLRSQDIVMKYNHQADSILARYRPDGERNSLKYNVDERGVHFSFKAKAKDAGLLESIRDGDLSSASFSFAVSDEPESQKWERRDDGSYLRTVNKFKAIADFSLVINPAYSEANVNTRGLDEFKQAEELAKVKIEEKRVEDEKQKEINETKLSDYYKKYDDIIIDLKK